MRKRLPIFIFTAIALAILIVAGMRWQFIHAWDTHPESEVSSALATFDSSQTNAPVIELSYINVAADRSLTSEKPLLPQTATYDSARLRAIYSYALSCKNPPKDTVDALKKTLIWSRFHCGETTTPPIEFFRKPPYMHPAGHSFAKMAIVQKLYPIEELLPYVHRSEFGGLKAVVVATKSATAKDLRFLTLAETNRGAIDRLSSGLPWVVDERHVFHKSERADYSEFYRILDRDAWNLFWSTKPFVPANTSRESLCVARNQDLCWVQNKNWAYQSASIIAGVAAFFLLGCIAWIITLYARKRGQRSTELAERLLMLQLLTHELRTPVTGIRLDIELLRREMKHLSGDAQTAFLRVCNGIQRLMRTLHASEGYLATFSQGGVVLDQVSNLPSINDFVATQVDAALDEVGPNRCIEFVPLTPDSRLKTNPEILAVCLRNLIDNAFKHGSGLVTVSITQEHQHLKISVQDEGELPSEYAAGRSFSVPFRKSNTSQGLGLGLFLVRRFAERLGGKLSMVQKPSTFTLSLPSEETT